MKALNIDDHVTLMIDDNHVTLKIDDNHITSHVICYTKHNSYFM